MSTIQREPPLQAEPSERGVNPLLSVVVPCLNEAETIGECVRRARAALDENAIRGEIIVVDNASDDGSGELAAAAGAFGA